MQDICPHRAAQLSDGQIIEGKIECLYHGWQFDPEGKCQHIPQLSDEAKIPNSACVQAFVVREKQGIIWFWRGKSEEADESLIPILPSLEQSEFLSVDIVRNLPFDQSYLIENVIDPAHANISHHGTPNGGNRANAQPLEMEIIENSLQGIKGKFRGLRLPNGRWSNLNFVAPNLIYYHFSLEGKNWSAGLAFYSLPLGNGKCRVLARNYRNFFTWKIKLIPRWFAHWNRNQLFEEDLQIIVGEKKQIEFSKQSIEKLWLPLKTSDLFVIEYRKWLDRYGSYLPYYQGYSTSKLLDEVQNNHQKEPNLERLKSHTEICNSCRRAYQTTIRCKQILIGMAITLAAVAIITDVSQIQMVAVVLSILSVMMIVVANQVKTRFERSYTR